jgi:hypothetical protein
VSLDAIHAGARHRRRQRRLAAAGTVLAVGMIAGSVAALTATRGELRGVAPADVAPQQQTRVTPVRSSARAVQEGAFDVTSFAEGRGVVVLGSEQCTRGCPSGPAALVVSTDHGLTFNPVGAPEGLESGFGGPEGRPRVHTVRFFGQQNGWLAGSDLWVTHDGGAQWGRVDVPGPFLALEVDGNHVWALRQARESVYELWSSPVRTNAWTKVEEVEAPPAAVARFGQEVGNVELAAGGGDAYLAVSDRLYRSDGKRFSTGCGPAERALVSVAVRAVWVACGDGARPWRAFVSTDRGANFRPVALQLSAVTALGARTASDAFVMNPQQTLARVRADGRRSALPERPETERPGGVYVAFASTVVGYAVPNDTGIWRTDDGGTTWRRLEVGAPAAFAE